MERRSTRSQITLDNDILKVPMQSPMKQARRARTNTASSSRSRLAEAVTAEVEGNSEDELLLSPNKRNGSPSSSNRKRSASPTPPNKLPNDVPEQGRDAKRVKRDADPAQDTSEEPVQTRNAMARVAGMHTRNHSDSNLVTRKTSKRVASRLASEKPRSVVSDEPPSRQGSLPPGDNGRAQSVPAFPTQTTHAYPHIDLTNLAQLPARNRSRSRSPSKHSTPKNPLKPLLPPLSRLPSIADEGASAMDVDEHPPKNNDGELTEHAATDVKGDAAASLPGEEQNSQGLAVDAESIELPPREPDALEPLTPLTPTTDFPAQEEMEESVVAQVEVVEKSQTPVATQTRSTRASKASSSKEAPPEPAPQIQKKKSQSRLPRPVPLTSHAPAMAVDAKKPVIQPAKNTKPTKPANGSKPMATATTSTTNGNGPKRNVFDVLMKRSEKATTSNGKDKSLAEKAKGILGSVPSTLAKGTAKATEAMAKTKTSSMKGKMKGKGAKAESKPAPALVPIPSDEEDILADDRPVNGKDSFLFAKTEPEAEMSEKEGAPRKMLAPEPIGPGDEDIYVDHVPPLGDSSNTLADEEERKAQVTERKPLAEASIAPDSMSGPSTESPSRTDLPQAPVEKASNRSQAQEGIVEIEEVNPFITDQVATLQPDGDANADEGSGLPPAADGEMHGVEEHIEYLVPLADPISVSEPPSIEEASERPAPPHPEDEPPEPVAVKRKSKAAGKKRAPSVAPAAPRVTRSASNREGESNTQAAAVSKAAGPTKTKQTTLKFPKAGARTTRSAQQAESSKKVEVSIPPFSSLKRKASDDQLSTASTRRKSVGPSMAHEAPKAELSTSISGRTRRKSAGPVPRTVAEPSMSSSGRARRKSLGGTSIGSQKSMDEAMAPVDLMMDTPMRKTARQILSISTPTLRTPASSPTKGTTRKTSVSPSKRAARSASPSPTKKAVRPFSMIGGRPDLSSMADNRFVKTGASSLSTLANALEALRMPAPSRPNTSLGFNDNGDSDDETPFAGSSSKSQDDSAVGKKGAVAGSSRNAGVSRAGSLGANHLKNKLAAIGTSGRTGHLTGRGGVPGRGKPLFGVGPVGRRIAQKASKNPSLPAVIGSPVKGGGDGDISMSNEEEDNLRNGFQELLQKTANDEDIDMEVEVTSTAGNKGKGKERPSDHSRRASMASQFLSQSRTSLLSEPSTSGKGNMGPPPVPAPKALARSASGSSALTTGSAEEASSEATPPGRRSTRTAAAAASQAIASVAASSRRAPAVESPPAPDDALKFLKDCTIFVDVRTEDGDEAGSLFIEMLEVAGARILGRVGQSCTHVVYKNGVQSTINRYRQLRDPKPLVVGIAWVVECVEQRTKVDEAEHIIDLEEVSLLTNPAKRRRSMLPRLMSRDASDFPTLGDSRDSLNDGDVSMDGSTSSVGMDDLTPLERARNRRQSALFPPPPQL